MRCSSGPFDAEQRHFWFRGFRRFVAPLLAEATAGVTQPSPAGRRLRHGRKPHVASPVRTSVRPRASLARSAVRTGARAAATHPGQRRRPAICRPRRSMSCCRSTCSTACTTPEEAAGHLGDVPRAAPRRCAHRQCRSDGDAEGRPLRPRRRGPSLHHASDLRAKLERAGLRVSAHHLHQRLPLPDYGHRAGASAPAGLEDRRDRTRGISTCRPRLSTRCCRARLPSNRSSSRPA